MHTTPPRRFFRRPSPAMLVASASLFVTLGGGAYASTYLPAHSVGARQLRADAVTSVAVKDRSLLASDFAPGQLPAGAKGDTGPKGDAGPAGAKGDTGPAGIAGVTVRTDNGRIPSFVLKQGEADCADGEVATGGGARIGAGGVASTALTHSIPVVDGSGKPVGWKAIALNTSPAEQEFAVYAICAKLS